MRLVPYAGTEQPRPRPLREKDRRAALLANIFERQKQARLLSEIGVEFGSLMAVREAVVAWLSHEIERNGNKRAKQCTTASRKRTLGWHGERTAPESVP